VKTTGDAERIEGAMTAREVSEQLRLRELLALRAAVGKSQGAGTKFKMANSHAIMKANSSIA
jgi:hypothetical protein